MKKTLILICAILVIALTLPVLVSCGSDSGSGTDTDVPAPDTKGSDDPSSGEIKGSEKTWGNITLFIPEGSSITGGSLINSDDPNALRILSSENEAYYYMISVYDNEATVVSSVETTKEMNVESSPEDVTFEAGGMTWSGIAYKYAGTSDCFQVWAKSEDKYILVGAGWHAYDSDETVKILGSIKIAG